jgi:hypothetical protein
MRIRKVTHSHAWELTLARTDHANVTGQPLVERAYWYEDNLSGVQYRDVYGCVGWPTEITDTDMGMPGYLAVVGVVKDDSAPENSKFWMLAEYEHYDIPTMLEQMVELRQEYGFGLHPGLMQGWHGDPERFVTAMALYNERLTVNDPGQAILIIPPADYSVHNRFDEYVRSLRSVIVRGRKRLYFNGFDVLKGKMQGFSPDCPAVLAVGGLVHTLLMTTMWMDQARENAFNVEDQDD